MKKLFVVLAIFHLTQLEAQDTTKVLFIGNSFTSQNNLPELFRQLSIGAGELVEVAAHMPGGISVGDTAQGALAHMNNPVVYDLIRSDDWDFLILQDNQGRFCLGYGQFPASSLVLEGHLMIRDSLAFHQPCASMVWFAGFGPKDGYPPYGNSGVALIDSIYQNYLFLNDTAEEVIAPIGPAFKRIISGYPSFNLWGADAIHPSLLGSYLTACVIFSTIYRSSPIRSSYNPGISVSADSILKITGYQATLDSLPFTGLLSITPEIIQSGNTLSINNSQQCAWYLNNSPIIATGCSVQIDEPGVYFALATDLSGCEYRSWEITTSVVGVPESLNIDQRFDLAPNPANRYSNITFHIPIETAASVELYDANGMLIRSWQADSSEFTMHLEGLAMGVYIVSMKSMNEVARRLLVIQ